MNIATPRLLLLALGLACAALPFASCRKAAKSAEQHAEKAARYFAAGDYPAAEIACKNLLRAKPDDVRAMSWLGTIWLERGSPVQALRYLERAAKQAPRDASLRAALAASYALLGDRTGARREALEAHRLEPYGKRPEVLMVLARSSEGPAEMTEAAGIFDSIPATDAPALLLAKATLALRREDPAAGGLIDQALALDPSSAEGHALKAAWHRARREADLADASYATALKHAGDRSPVRIEHARYLIETGRRDEAAAALAAATARTPDFLAAWRLQAQLRIDAEDPKGAEKMLQPVFDLDATDFEASLLQSMVWLSSGDAKLAEKAVRLMTKVKESHPPSLVIELQLARAYLAEGREGEAAAALKRAAELQPEFRDTILMQARLKLQMEQAEEAIGPLEAWLAKHPDDAEAHWILADACTATRRFDRALELFARLGGNPDAGFRPHLESGRILLLKGRTDEARKAFEEADRLSPGNPRTAFELVALDLKRSDFDAAAKRVAAQREKHPDAAASHYLAATVFMARGMAPEAAEAAAEALRRDAAFVPAHELLAKLQLSGGKTADAVVHLQRIIELKPDNLAARMALGMIDQQAGRTAEARAAYEEILRRAPDYVAALNNLAGLLAESPAELDRARQLAEQARALAPDEAAIADTLGWILLQQGNATRAGALLLEAADKLPDSPTVRYRAGLAAYRAGDEAAATAAFDTALRSTAAFPEREQARAKRERLAELAAASSTRLAELLAEDPRDGIVALRLARLLEPTASREAEQAYQAALAANPSLAAAHLGLARLQAGPLARPELAIESATKARELNPADPAATALLARLAFAQGKHEWADSLFQEVLGSLPNDLPLLIDAARAAFSVGRVDDARRLFETVASRGSDPAELAAAARLLDFVPEDVGRAQIEEALRLDPSHVPALMARARLLEREGDREGAIRDGEAALRIYPKFTPASDMVRRLKADAARDEEAPGDR
jgi:tetratricopeptide (TPR) repeat protein